MRLYFIDDSNISYNSKLDFLLYGGLIVDQADVRSMIIKYYDIREQYQIERERPVKWDNFNWERKGTLDPETHKNIKSNVLELVAQTNCKIIIYMSPHYFSHDIVTSSTNLNTSFVINSDKLLRSVKYGINVCLEKFNNYLTIIDDYGLVLADDFSQTLRVELTKHCNNIFLNGTMTWSGGLSSVLDRISYPVIETRHTISPFHQINDIVIGAIQSSLKEVSPNLVKTLKNNFWSVDNNIVDFGFNLYPKSFKSSEIERKVRIVEQKFHKLIS
ncbi:MAG: DUF3800 domain-containing protein [Ignavibacteria bacterium]